MQSCSCKAVTECVAPSRSWTRTVQLRSGRSVVGNSRRLAPRVLAVAPGVPAPKGVTQPPREPEVPPATFGFVDNAERINSRACMIGFFALIAVEAIAHRGFLELIGIRVGNGLGFEI